MGAFCACELCGIESSGDVGLDMEFTDHHHSEATLVAFGEVIKRIKNACKDDDGLVPWAFIKYVSDHHPDILSADIPPAIARDATRLLKAANITPVKVVASSVKAETGNAAVADLSGQELRQLAVRVGEVLNSYIKVHNRIHGEASTFRSVIKNILGRGVPMADLLADAERLVPEIESVRAELSSLGSPSAKSWSAESRHYLRLLKEYAEALHGTIEALVRRQQLLAKGAQGGRGNPMTWPAFQDADREYDRAIARYKAVGLDLNKLAHVIAK
jgi:hypothetical protein